jgi:quinol---cytochrome c reductase iron-sulfur subunit
VDRYQIVNRERGTESQAARVVAAAFALSAAGSVGLAFLYLRGGQPQLEGTLIGFAMGGLALGFIVWAHRLMPPGPFVEEREPMPSASTEREAFERDLVRGERAIRRRTFLSRMLFLAVGALGAALVFPIRSLGPKPGRSLFMTAWRRGARVVSEDGRPLKVTDLPLDNVLTVFPEGHLDAADSQTLLIHVPSGALRRLPGRESWSPQDLVAYSKICTHAGCPVGLYEAESQRLFCPCHQSVFDVLDGARPISGPATRALPQLPLSVDPEGYLRAQSDYPRPVGPAFWNEP